VERQGLDRGRARGHRRGGVVLVVPEQPALFLQRLVEVAVQALGASGPHRPVDEADTDDDAADDADRGDGEGEIGSLGEAEILHDAPHAGRGAVPALETELDEGADHGAGTEEGDEDGGGQGEAQHVLPGGEGHAHRHLRSDQAEHALGVGDLRAEEQGGEDDADEQAGQRAPHVEDLRGVDPGLGEAVAAHPLAQGAEHLGTEQEGHGAADDRAGQEELLDQGRADPDALRHQQDEPQQHQSQSDRVRRHRGPPRHAWGPDAPR